MGLLERALKYKNKLNNNGKETLIDRIKGPAETKVVHAMTETLSLDESIQEDDSSLAINEESTDTPIVHLTENDITEVEESDGEIYKVEEEIVFFDDDVESEVKTEEKADNVYDEVDFNFDLYEDYHVLFEIFKDLIKCENISDLYEVLTFSIMGQLGVSSASILISNSHDSLDMVHSSGIHITDPVSWDIGSGFFSSISFSHEVVDLESFKDDKNLREDYFRFVSVDARMVTPVFLNSRLYGAILVGEKLDEELYSEMDFIFLKYLAQMFSISLKSISRTDETVLKLKEQTFESEITSDVEIFQDRIMNVKSSEDLLMKVRESFDSLGIEIFTIFSFDKYSDEYVPKFYEDNDYFEISQSRLNIDPSSQLVKLLKSKKTPLAVDNFSESPLLIDIYGSSRISLMDNFLIYPFIFSEEMPGFIVINKYNNNVSIDDIDIRMRKIVKFIFPCFNEFTQLEYEKSKVNNFTMGTYQILNRKYEESKEIGVPFSIVKLFFTNAAVCKNKYGVEKLFEFYKKAEEFISDKISMNDVLLEIDMNKHLLVLPGKDKKYIANLIGVLKNEIHEFSDLNLSYIVSSIPGDGEDVFDLLDNLG